MDVLNTFSSWLLDCCTLVGQTVFSNWGILGSAIFGILVLRKLVDIFKNSY